MYRFMMVWMIVGGGLLSCATKYASNDKQQYLSARNGPVLEVPSSLSRENLSEFYELSSPVGDKKVSILPPQAS